jgi:hypothetical protein
MSLTTVARRLPATLLRTEDPTALGLVRILVVSVFTASLLSHVGSVAEYFSDASMLGGDAAREAFHSRWSLFFSVGEPWAVQAIFAVGVVAHVCWLVGLWTPIAAVVSWFLWVCMVGRNPILYALPDQLHMAVCTLLMLMPSGRGLSLDARRRGARPVPVWCRGLIQLQLAVMYTATGLLKTGPTWHEQGTALYYALANPYNRHFDLGPTLAAMQPWLLRPMTWLVLVWESAFGAFVALHWLRTAVGRPRRFVDLRWPMLGFGVAMHLGIQSMMYVAWFTPLTLAAYASFLRPEEASRLLARWPGRRPAAPA